MGDFRFCQRFLSLLPIFSPFALFAVLLLKKYERVNSRLRGNEAAMTKNID
ncbi:MAG: hypothetical protein UX70_C0001G0206 [Candidatus Wolfebacteria bacterium GW2011_GWB1_47_1]|uniref:Uncharacterized protein n=1 Tax=Candidatus Wolfebacteria bacterium GW2011_GWB1_47_1 TaxID=1619007 RepID=A0A0G4ARL3_9BACT|nr:MAG: hypothetical protein UX70_C0001G0206 [Candidatus Wolfebacteria bacterium GW2011_GWB1_47_1]